jgi:hypothetical protein
MPKMPSVGTKPIAARIAEEITGFELKGKNLVAVVLGRRGAINGGRARAEKLTAEQRGQNAKIAAQSHWKEDR